MNRDFIKTIIPHREPFLLVDEIISMETGKTVEARLTLTGHEYFFAGHFPGTPIMPGVLIIEAMAQAGAVALLSMERFKGKLGFFAGIDKARFKRKVVPGDTIVLNVEITGIRANIGFGRGTASVNGELAASAEITFAVGQ